MISTSGHYRLCHAIEKVQKESAEQEREITADRVYQRLLDVEANKVMSEVMVIVQSNQSATEKIRQLCDLLGMTEDENDEDVTGVTIHATTTR